MIITKQKDFRQLLESIGEDPVFIVGCSDCATLCNTGGEKELKSMKDALEKKNIEVTGTVILEPACHLQNDKRIFRQYKKEIDKANKVLVLACGNGFQTVSEILDEIEIISGNDTLFLGEIKRINEFEKRCILCGDCNHDIFGGLCPVSRCPKNMLNGPCGGVNNGKCEVSFDIECVWDKIYKYLKEKERLHILKNIIDPKDWSKSNEFRRVL